MFRPAAPNVCRAWFSVIEVMMPTATVAVKTAMIRPLIARNAPFGSSASRRAASSPAGPLARRASSAEPAMVSHDPAMTSPATISAAPPR